MYRIVGKCIVAALIMEVSLPSFAPDRYTQNGLGDVPSLHIHLTVEPSVAVWITDVQDLPCACYVARDASRDGKPCKKGDKREVRSLHCKKLLSAAVE